MEIDDKEVAVSRGESITKDGFKITRDVNGEINIESLATEVRISLKDNGNSWSVGVPPVYRSNTLGLCGTCDNNKDNEFWTGLQVPVIHFQKF